MRMIFFLLLFERFHEQNLPMLLLCLVLFSTILWYMTTCEPGKCPKRVLFFLASAKGNWKKTFKTLKNFLIFLEEALHVC